MLMNIYYFVGLVFLIISPAMMLSSFPDLAWLCLLISAICLEMIFIENALEDRKTYYMQDNKGNLFIDKP